jgi:hypothetical protein
VWEVGSIEIRRDYIERLIEECVRALLRAAHLREAGQLDVALRVVREHADELLGPLRLVQQLEASSAVEVAGRSQFDRLRVYAALVGEEGVIHQARGDTMSAALACRRSLELFAALSLTGAQLAMDDLRRMAVLSGIVGMDQLDARYRDELRRLASRGGPRS